METPILGPELKFRYMKKIIMPILLVLAVSWSTTAQIKVFQTAKDTDDRLSQLEDVALESFGQPTEGQPCVFIEENDQQQHLVENRLSRLFVFYRKITSSSGLI